MKYIQHNDPIILIPQHISRQAFYSIQMILFCSGLAFYLQYYITCPLLFIIYITSLLHWNKILRHGGLVKYLDII